MIVTIDIPDSWDKENKITLSLTEGGNKWKAYKIIEPDTAKYLKDYFLYEWSIIDMVVALITKVLRSKRGVS